MHRNGNNAEEKTGSMPISADIEDVGKEKGRVTDTELVSRFKAGDEKAFSCLVNRYRERLIRLARSIVGDEDEAVDISQEAFVKAYYNLKKFREDASFYTWIYRITYNLGISIVRRKKVVSFFSLDDGEETREFVSNGPDPYDELERKEFRTALREAVARLPERQRTVFLMKQVDGLKHEEIGHILGVTEGAIKASYFQAVQKLRHYLGEFNE